MIIQKPNYLIIIKNKVKRYKSNPTKLVQFSNYLLNKILDDPTIGVENTIQKNVKTKLKSLLSTNVKDD